MAALSFRRRHYVVDSPGSKNCGACKHINGMLVFGFAVSYNNKHIT